MKDQIITDFPDRLRLVRNIEQTARGLKLGFKLECRFTWKAPVDHLGQYLTLEQHLRRLRKSVGASVQIHVMEPALFLHGVRDSDSIGLHTLYERYVRSLFASCLSRLGNDHVGLIMCGEYNVMWFANIETAQGQQYIDILCTVHPHVEPDWRLDDFCRREVQLYAHDLYGDRLKPSLEEFRSQEELDELTDNELREHAYRRNTFSSAQSWENMSRMGTIALLYSYDINSMPRYNMPVADRLKILPRRIDQNSVTQQEAFFWMRILGRDYKEALQDSQREAYRSILLTDLRGHLANATRD